MRSSYWHSFFVLCLAAALAVFLMAADHELLKRERAARESLVAVAYLETSFPDKDGATWVEKARAQLPEAIKIDFISKADALQTAQSDPSLAKALLMLKDNPLPSSVSVRFSDDAWLYQADPADALKALAEISEIRWNPAVRDALRATKVWRRRIQKAGWGLGVLLLIWIIGACRLGNFKLKRRYES